jgi:hypothetical protein
MIRPGMIFAKAMIKGKWFRIHPFSGATCQRNTDWLEIFTRLTNMADKEIKLRCIERRSLTDRRNSKRFKIRTLFVYGQRKAIRRQDDRYKIYYLDRYSPTLFACIVAILLLSVIDALLTLYLVDHGAVELNPLMAFYLNSDPLVFMSIKYLLTSASVFILLMCGNVTARKINITINSLFPVLIAAFASIVAWQLFLIYKVVY